MNIKKFIDSEINYFSPMIERSRRVSIEERQLWALETVRERQLRVSREVYELTKGKVRYGPFRGLSLVNRPWWGGADLGSQCLGLYELEVLSVIDEFSPGQFSCFIDIGAGDGYYAIGMLVAKKVPMALCFEESEEGRQTIQTNHLNNGSVGSLKILGSANAKSILELPEQYFDNAFVLVDVEGYEFDLLTDDVLKKLNSCTIIIEIHNWVDDFLNRYSRFLQKADKFFHVKVIDRIDRQTSKITELRDFTDDNRLLLLSERRPCLMRFLMLTEKNS